MNTNMLAESKLPLPRWFYIGLAIPTFIMPLPYLSLVIWAFWSIISDRFIKQPVWINNIPLSIIWYFVVVMWFIYLLWIVISKRLTWQEKGCWLFVVTFFNMIGMPIFYVFMLRRYLGIEGRTNKHDEAALDKFLTRCNLSRASLSPEQTTILRSHCRNYRFVKWGIVIGVLLAAFSIDFSFYYVPKHTLPIFAEFTPTQIIIIDKVNDTKEEINPDPITRQQGIEIIYKIGVGQGMFFLFSLCILLLCIINFFGNWDRRVFVKFLKASNPNQSNKSSFFLRESKNEGYST